MTEKLITSNLRVQQAKQLVDSLSGSNTSVEYYSFVGNHVTYPDGDGVIPVPNNSIDCVSSNVYQNMIFGKKIANSDVSYMVRNVPWTTNTVYAMYEHDDPTLLSNNFFVAVSEGSYYYVYKCLFNNGGLVSTIQPSFASSTQETDLFDADDGYYRTSDGYQWKYLYTIPAATYTKFATSEYVPLVVNTSVANAAVNGAIDVVKVVSGGARYDNFFSSVFGQSDLRVTANIVGLSAYTNRMYSFGSNRSTANIAGSVAVTNGQSNVVGTSTLFTTALDVGDYIKIQNSTASEIRKVESITNNTLLSVSTSWTNSFSGANTLITYPFEANGANDFYNYCILKIVAGTGSGQYRTINDFVNDGDKKIAVLDSEFSIAPDTTSRYEVSPGITIYGSGTETITAVGRALINSSSSNSVYAVEMLARGKGYIKATSNVAVSTIVGVTAIANLKPIISPPNGHGANVALELGATAVGISIQFQNNESSRITTHNDYRQIGIMKNPCFANVELNIVQPGNSGVAGGEGSFLENETIRQFTMIQLNGTVSVNTTSAGVTHADADLTESVNVSDALIIKSGNNWFTANVVSITNSTYMTLTSNGVFVNSAANFYKATFLAAAEILTVSAGLMYVSSNTGTLTPAKKIIGLNSYAVANVANVQINNEDVSSGINTFRQMTYYTGTKTGTFTADETVYQTTANNRSAKFHSSNNIGGTDYLYITNQFGIFDLGSTLVGETSNAVFTITNKYNGDVHPQSGEIVYLQNGSAISRSNTQTEKIKIVIEY